MANNCTHKREDFTSCIAWAEQSDGHTRGICQRCLDSFSPFIEECTSKAAWEEYENLRRVPYTRLTNYPIGDNIIVIDSASERKTSESRQDVLYRILLKACAAITEIFVYGWTKRRHRANVAYLATLSYPVIKDFLHLGDAAQLLEQRTGKVKEIVARLENLKKEKVS